MKNIGFRILAGNLLERLSRRAKQADEHSGRCACPRHRASPHPHQHGIRLRLFRSLRSNATDHGSNGTRVGDVVLQANVRTHVTRHTSHVTRHTSHVTRHTSHLLLPLPPDLRLPLNLIQRQRASQQQRRHVARYFAAAAVALGTERCTDTQGARVPANRTSTVKL
jgi:hypothetical protein